MLKIEDKDLDFILWLPYHSAIGGLCFHQFCLFTVLWMCQSSPPEIPFYLFPVLPIFPDTASVPSPAWSLPWLPHPHWFIIAPNSSAASTTCATQFGPYLYIVIHSSLLFHVFVLSHLYYVITSCGKTTFSISSILLTLLITVPGN